jgi:hypothetical protein
VNGRPPNPDSLAGRIRQAIIDDPSARNPELARRFGCTTVYVIQVRRRMKLAELARDP